MNLFRTISITALVAALSLVSAGAFAQLGPDGLFLLDNGETLAGAETTRGHVTTLGDAQEFSSDLFFGFDVAEDIELVENETGVVTGYYLLDAYGGQHEVGDAIVYNVTQKPYFNYDIARDLETVNVLEANEAGDFVIKEQIGYYTLDGYGGVHPVNNTVDFPFRRQSSANPNLKVYNDSPSAFAAPFNFPYLGWDIMRDMEVSYLVTMVSVEGQTQITAESNGYYLLDGIGGIHNCREDGEGNLIQAPWEGETGRPYFGWDIARDLEIAPDGEGYYLLDGFGGMHIVGSATLDFGAGITKVPPYFGGFDVYEDFELVVDANGRPTGYYALDQFGVIYSIGNAPDMGQVSEVLGDLDIFRDLEVSSSFTGVSVPK